jgi:3-oxoacyl-[acyl-carrier protein] reductase
MNHHSDARMENDAGVALVTGGSRGIGLACAKELARSGFSVAATYNSSPPPAEVRNGFDGKAAIFTRMDVTDAKSVETAFEEVESRLGPVGVLVANAGVAKDRLVLRMSEQDFQDVLDTNLTGAFRCVKRALGPMIKNRAGKIILISSVAGLSGSPGQANYAASKAGLIGMALSLAREVASRNVTVNVVAPGLIDTQMLEDVTPKRRQELEESIPLGRIGSPEDVAGAVGFLASPKASYITGTVVRVDGGLAMGG